MTAPLEIERDPEPLSAAAWRLRGPGDLSIIARFSPGKSQRNCRVIRRVIVPAAIRRRGRLPRKLLASPGRRGAPSETLPDATGSRAGGARKEPASTAANDALRMTERKLMRHLQRNKFSMSVGLVLGAAAFTAGLCTSHSIYRCAFLCAAGWELGVLPVLCVAVNRRMQRVLSFVQQELRAGAAQAVSRDLQIASQLPNHLSVTERLSGAWDLQ